MDAGRGVSLHARLSAGRALAAVLLLAPIACTAVVPRPSGTATRRIVLGDVPMVRCSASIEGAVCGTLRVPEHPGDPDGPTIELRVVVVPAATDEPAPDPVFFLAGGPGGAATTTWAHAPELFAELHGARDIVLVDQRGTGGSRPLVGPPLPNAGPGEDPRAVAGAWFREALADADVDLARFTSAEAADDLDAVRAALGYEGIDLYGASYGATLAQYYLRRHSDHVRAVVLDGGTLLDVPIFELVARRSAEALASVFTRCRADAACREAFPDPAGDLATVLRDLRRQPSTIEVRTPVSTREVTITADAFADAIHELLVRSRGAEIPATLALAAAGDLGTVGAVVAELEQDDDSYRLLMSWAIRCSEPWARFRPGRVAALGPDSYLLGSQLAGARTTRIACAAMPPLRDDEENGPVRSDLPVLLLNGAEDPQDPPSNVTDAPVELPNSLAIEVVGYGHTVGHLGCLPDVVAAFFASGTVQDLETACVTEMEPPPFALP